MKFYTKMKLIHIILIYLFKILLLTKFRLTNMKILRVPMDYFIIKQLSW